jgi:phosphonatase-like hydrolase
MMARCRLVVCDLAGTTIDDSEHVATAFVRALREQGIDVAASELTAIRGASKRQAISRFIPDGPAYERRAEAAYAAFQHRLRQLYRDNGVHALDGVESFFQRLRARSVCIALNTGFDKYIADLLLESLGWGPEVVDAVICGDEVSEGRPAPFLIFRAMEATRVGDVHEVMTAGDTALDLWAGYHAGVRWNVGVLTGAHDRDTLSKAPHTHLVPSLVEVPAIWDDP